MRNGESATSSAALDLLVSVANMKNSQQPKRQEVMSIANLLNDEEGTTIGHFIKHQSAQEPLTPITPIEMISVSLKYNSTLHYHRSGTSSHRFSWDGLCTPATTAPPSPHFSHIQAPSQMRLHVCEICQEKGLVKSFQKKHHLLSHMVTHSDDYRYVCDVPNCKSKFRRNQDLLRHLRRVKHTDPRKGKVAGGPCLQSVQIRVCHPLFLDFQRLVGASTFAQEP
ncbi:hypothetical protein BC830DRAFT_503250 [Chytriomyces sp. MP71]|nr:hypothetical protein BC830DRAFT_503250 [Chytriomyces sp. MP71]